MENRKKLIIVLVLVIGLFFFWQYSAKSTTNSGITPTPNPNIPDGRTSGGGEDQPETPASTDKYLFAATVKPLRQTDEGLANYVRNSNGTYSDNAVGDTVAGNTRTRTINGNLCKAHYFVNGSVLTNSEGQEIDFSNISLPAGQIIGVEKIWMKATFTGSTREMFDAQVRPDIRDAFVITSLKHFTT